MIVLALTIAVRVYLIATTAIISRDGVTFIYYARGLAADPIAEVRKQDQHPGYPAILLATHSLIGGWLAEEPVDQWPLAGQVAAMVFGLGAVMAAYAIGTWLWSSRIGLITALFMGMLPRLCQVSSDALSDAPHLALYLWGLAFLIRALRTDRLVWLLAAAAYSGLAFLVRPEGGSILVVGIVVVMIQRDRRLWPWRRRLAAVAAMGAVFLALAGPYMAASGRVIKKKNIFELIGFDEDPASAAVERRVVEPTPSRHRADSAMPTPVFLIYYWIRACRVVYFVLAIPVLFVGHTSRPREALPLAVAGVLHLTLLYALRSSFGYLSLRHTMVLAALTLPFSAWALCWLVDQIVARSAFERTGIRPRLRGLATLIGAVCAIAPTTPYILRTIGGDSEYLIEAGRWLRAHSEAHQSVMTTRLRLAYYADRPRYPWPDTGKIEDLRGALEKYEPDFVAVDAGRITAPHRNPDFFAELARSEVGRRLRKIDVPQAGRERVVIYRVLGAASLGSGRSNSADFRVGNGLGQAGWVRTGQIVGLWANRSSGGIGGS